MLKSRKKPLVKNSKEPAAKTKAAPAAKQQAANNNDLPLFFKNPQMLNNQRHKNAGILPDKGMSFARDTNSIVITGAEFIEASKYYPIVFTTGKVLSPAVIVGLEQENYFIDAKGVWQEGTYIPAYARQYPFVFVERPEAQQLTLCVDEDSVHYTSSAKDSKTARLYEIDGKPSAFTNSALEFCGALQKEHLTTQEFCKTLQELDMFMPQQMEGKLKSGRAVRMAGFQSINPAKLDSLPNDKIIELYKKGFLALMFFAISSMGNWNRLARMANK